MGTMSKYFLIWTPTTINANILISNKMLIIIVLREKIINKIILKIRAGYFAQIFWIGKFRDKEFFWKNPNRTFLSQTPYARGASCQTRKKKLVWGKASHALRWLGLAPNTQTKRHRGTFLLVPWELKALYHIFQLCPESPAPKWVCGIYNMYFLPLLNL